MKFIVCLLVLVAVAHAKPIMSDQDQSQSLADTAKTLQSIAHMAVVDMISPLHVSLSSLESSWINLVKIASQEDHPIPQLSIPKIDVKSILTCQAKSSPKYSMVLQDIMEHQDKLQGHILNAKKLTDGLKFVSQLIMYKQVDDDTMSSVSQKMSEYLKDYASTISAIKSTVCRDQSSSSSSSSSSSHPMTESYMDTPLSVFLKGTMPTGGGVSKGFGLSGGGVGKGFSLSGGGVGKGYSLSGGAVDKGFDLSGGGVGKGFNLSGGGVGKGFDLTGGGVGKGYNLNGDMIDEDAPDF